jgi:hypothetical protein
VKPVTKPVERLADPQAKAARAAGETVELLIEQVELAHPGSHSFGAGSPHDFSYLHTRY